MTRPVAIQSAETMAFMRAVVTGEKNLAVRSEDRLARHFVGRTYRLLISVSLQPILRRVVEFLVPGSYGFTITRTRHFDEILQAECRTGIEQVVLLGAGYDSRPFRFREALRNIRVFEIDHPGTQARKRDLLARIEEATPCNVVFIPADFTQQTLPEVLAAHGFSAEKKTLFLWEGVSYYLPRPVVEGVLDFVAGCAAGSSILFDYATAAYVNGDVSTVGGREVARWLKKVREPFVFGLDPAQTEDFLAARRLQAISDLGPRDLAQSYLKSGDGGSIGETFGHIRMVHARTTGLRLACPAAGNITRNTTAAVSPRTRRAASTTACGRPSPAAAWCFRPACLRYRPMPMPRCSAVCATSPGSTPTTRFTMSSAASSSAESSTASKSNAARVRGMAPGNPGMPARRRGC